MPDERRGGEEVHGGGYIDQTGIATWGEAKAKGIFQNIGDLKERIAKGEKVIGLSLSFCIAAILRGEIKEQDIEKIVTGAKAATDPEGIKETIKIYREYYWKDNPDEGEAIARRFLSAGKIEYGGDKQNIGWGKWQVIDKPKDPQ